jgi:phosphotransferase system  glucose/maltose/N-acetylglucosamine-specific IIC component
VHARCVASPLFAGGAGKDGLVTTPKLFPPTAFLPVLLFFSALLLGLLLLLLWLLL